MPFPFGFLALSEPFPCMRDAQPHIDGVALKKRLSGFLVHMPLNVTVYLVINLVNLTPDATQQIHDQHVIGAVLFPCAL